MALLVWVMTGLAALALHRLPPRPLLGRDRRRVPRRARRRGPLRADHQRRHDPGQDDTTLLTGLEAIPGAVLGMAVVWFAGVRAARQPHARVTRPRFLAAISTPFDADGAPRPRRLRRAPRVAARDSGWTACSSRARRARACCSRTTRSRRWSSARSRPPAACVVAQVGRPSTRATVRLARARDRARRRRRRRLRAVVLPGHRGRRPRATSWRCSEAAGDTPAFLYNIPRRTVNDLSRGAAGELAEAGYAGMKDSTGDFDRHGVPRRARRPRLRALHGLRAARAARGPAGAAGAVTGLAGARPDLFARWRDALEAGDERRGRARPGRDRGGAQGRSTPRARRSPASSAASPPPSPGYPPAPRPPFA